MVRNTKNKKREETSIIPIPVASIVTRPGLDADALSSVEKLSDDDFDYLIFTKAMEQMVDNPTKQYSLLGQRYNHRIAAAKLRAWSIRTRSV